METKSEYNGLYFLRAKSSFNLELYPINLPFKNEGKRKLFSEK